ncbi:YndM family protein [Rossellomorea vietnamensis]|uniref:YndM family protein n=1 Tax=Rossellomorea vietnamensis TaxID=218284 RepID=UPI003CF5F6A7
MEHLKALAIKFVMVAVVLGIILTGIYGVPVSDMLIVSVILTLGAYVLGDLLVFKRLNGEQKKRNVIATMADAGLAFVLLWFLGTAMFPDHNVIMASLISAIVIAAGEWFFHKYLDNSVFTDNRSYHSDPIHH